MYRRLYPSTPDARRFAAIFNDERYFTVYDRMGVRRDKIIGCWNCRRGCAGQWWAGIMGPVGCFNVPLARHADKLTYVCTLRRMMGRTNFN